MSATRDLIAAALTAADELDELHKEGRNPATFTPSVLREACARAMVQPDMAEVRPGMSGWKEATIAWEVCASIHREYAKKKDPFFTTRQADFVKHAACARAMVQPAAPDMGEVERLADVYADHVFSDGLLGRKVPSEHAATARTALLDYVRGVAADIINEIRRAA